MVASDTTGGIAPLGVARGAYNTAPAVRHHGSPMKIINLLHVVLAQAFYRWAMREINPMHPDVPRIMMRQHQLAEKQRQIWA